MKCQVLIDWLTFSVKEADPNKVIQTYLGMDPDLFQDTGYSLMGYNKVLRFSDILVCSDGREDDYFKDNDGPGALLLRADPVAQVGVI